MKLKIMKTTFLILGCMLCNFNYKLNAQNINEGIYLSSNDFISGKISFANNESTKKYKLYINEIFYSSNVKILIGDSIIKFNKDSIYGYRDKNHTSYRFYNKVAYKIINPKEKILLYSRIMKSTGAKGIMANVTSYFFSESLGSPIYPLTKWNLKVTFSYELLFHELLDIYFHNDKDLIAYDRLNKIYYLNHVYELSKQKTMATNFK